MWKIPKPVSLWKTSLNTAAPLYHDYSNRNGQQYIPIINVLTPAYDPLDGRAVKKGWSNNTY